MSSSIGVPSLPAGSRPRGGMNASREIGGRLAHAWDRPTPLDHCVAGPYHPPPKDLPEDDMTNPMLPRERCDYSAIVDREPLKLPGNARLIFWSIVNYEVWDIG